MGLRDIPIKDLVISDLNTRKDLEAGTEDSSLRELAASIRSNGLLNPIVVRSLPHSGYEVIAGQRRFLACASLGWAEIPALVKEADDHQAQTISLIENVHRADLHPLDKARAYQALLEYFEGDIQRVSKESGVRADTIRKYLAILRLPETIKRDLSTREGPAKIEALYTLARSFPDPADAQTVFGQIQGFTQDVQVRILRDSHGDASRIPPLVEKALAGGFSVRMCHGVGGVLMCEVIPEELAPEVMKLVDNQMG